MNHILELRVRVIFVLVLCREFKVLKAHCDGTGG